VIQRLGILQEGCDHFFSWSERPLCEHKARVKEKNGLQSRRSKKPIFESRSVYIRLPKLPFLASLSLNFSTRCLHMLSKFIDKSAQKASSFASKANYAKSLFI